LRCLQCFGAIFAEFGQADDCITNIDRPVAAFPPFRTLKSRSIAFSAALWDILLIFNDRVLDNSLSLEFQGVRNGDPPVVSQRNKRPASPALTSFHTKIQPVLLEVLRINDNHYQSLEMHQKGDLTSRRLRDYGEVDPWDGCLTTAIPMTRDSRKVNPNFMEREDFSHLINLIKFMFRRVCGKTREMRFDFKHHEKSER
jgi:hypothetical protein